MNPTPDPAAAPQAKPSTADPSPTDRTTSRPAGAGHRRPPAALPRLLPVAGPLFGELILGMSVGVVATALAARLGDAQGAALALAVQVAAMLFIVFRIVGAGVSVVVSQALGGGRRDEADHLARATLGASTWIGSVCGLGCSLGAEPLLRMLNAPPDVLPLALPLLRWLGLGVLLDSWNTTLASVLRSHLRGRATLVVNTLIQATHLGLAWPLMARWGADLGLVGYALALLVSRTLGTVLLLQLWRRQLDLRPQGPDWWRLRGVRLLPVLHIGLPGAAENIAWRTGFMVSVAVAGHLGTQALATQAYTLQVMHVLLVFGLATGLAAEMLVGRLVGAGQFKQAHALVQAALRRGLLVSTGTALLAALAGPWIIGCFSQDPAIVALGSRLLWITVALESGRCFNVVVGNALRAAGDARYPLTAGAASFALVMAGGSWWLGLHCGLGLVGVWIAYAADEWLRGLLMWRRWLGLHWVPAARRTRRRLKLRAA